MIINDNLEDFINNINKGKVVCFKTDTIWGFSALANNLKAVEQLHNIKNKNYENPFIYIIKQNQDLNELVKTITPNAQKLINSFWAGPLTIIFEAKENLPFLKPYKNNTTIAIRMPDDSLCQTILSKLNAPLVSTSVNINGEEFINNFNDICEYFKNEDVCILSLTENTLSGFNKEIDATKNNQTKNIYSTMVCCKDDEVKILREGTISTKDIEQSLKN